jgi:hypothetical protein
MASGVPDIPDFRSDDFLSPKAIQRKVTDFSRDVTKGLPERQVKEIFGLDPFGDFPDPFEILRLTSNFVDDVTNPRADQSMFLPPNYGFTLPNTQPAPTVNGTPFLQNPYFRYPTGAAYPGLDFYGFISPGQQVALPVTPGTGSQAQVFTGLPGMIATAPWNTTVWGNHPNAFNASWLNVTG